MSKGPLVITREMKAMDLEKIGKGKQKRGLMKGFTIREKMFLREYLKTGSSYKSYKKVYKCADSTAGVAGTRILKKAEGILPLLYEKYGVTEGRIAQVISNAFDAKHYVHYKGETFEHPDHMTRLAAVREAKHILDPQGKGGNVNQMNVVIVEDREKGIVSLSEEDKNTS